MDTKDLFGSLLFFSAKATLFLKVFFSFLFSYSPRASMFAYPDGTVRQNDKSTVFHDLNKHSQSSPL